MLTLSAARAVHAAYGSIGPAVRGLLATPHLVRLQSGRELPSRLLALFTLLFEEYRRPYSLHSPVCVCLTHALLWLIGREVQAQANTPILAPLHGQQENFERFQSLLERRYQGHWTVARYARALGMTSARLTRLSLALAGCSAFEHIQRKLQAESQRRLIYTALSIKSIAGDLGFTDAAYFCRFFRRRCHVSPHRFTLRHPEPLGNRRPVPQ